MQPPISVASHLPRFPPHSGMRICLPPCPAHEYPHWVKHKARGALNVALAHVLVVFCLERSLRLCLRCKLHISLTACAPCADSRAHAIIKEEAAPVQARSAWARARAAALADVRRHDLKVLKERYQVLLCGRIGQPPKARGRRLHRRRAQLLLPAPAALNVRHL